MGYRKSTREVEADYLVEKVGMERAHAERALEDSDLWLLLPECRYVPGSAGEEPDEVHEWERAFEFAKALCRGFADAPLPGINTATQHLLWDMRDRAEEALRRARERA